MANSPTPAPPLADATGSVPSLRTLGTGANQAAAGNDSRFSSLSVTSSYYSIIQNPSGSDLIQRPRLQFSSFFTASDSIGDNLTAIDAKQTGSAGTYTNATVQIDQWGRVTSASNGTGGGSGHIIQSPSGTALTTRSILAFEIQNFSGTDVDNTSLVTFKTTGSAGTYNFASIVVDQWGRVTSASNNSAASAHVIHNPTGVALAQRSKLSFTQRFSGSDDSGNDATVIDIKPTGSAGTYTNATVVIDQWGFVTSASNGTGGSGHTIQAPSGTNLTTRSILSFETENFSGSDDGGASVVHLKKTGSFGTYTFSTVTVDQWGRVTSAANGTVVQGHTIQAPSGTALTTRQVLAFDSNNFSGSDDGGADVVYLKTTGSAGTYTAANIKIDQWGRITSASNGNSGGGVGSTGQTFITIIPGGLRAANSSSVPQVVAGFFITPADHVLTNSSASFFFKAALATGNTFTTGSVRLRNITDNNDVATLTVLGQTTAQNVSAGITLPAGSKLYEVRLFASGSGGVTDTAELYSAEVRILNTVT